MPEEWEIAEVEFLEPKGPDNLLLVICHFKEPDPLRFSKLKRQIEKLPSLEITGGVWYVRWRRVLTLAASLERSKLLKPDDLFIAEEVGDGFNCRQGLEVTSLDWVKENGEGPMQWLIEADNKKEKAS